MSQLIIVLQPSHATKMPAPELRDFGNKQSDLHTILSWATLSAIPIGIAAFLYNVVPTIKSIRSEEIIHPQIMEVTGFLCFALFYLALFNYLSKYARDIWSSYYQLDTDQAWISTFVFSGIVMIIVASFWGQYWPFYVIILFIQLALYKQKRRSVFSSAFKRSLHVDPDDFPADRLEFLYESVSNRHWLARCNLANSFYRNFVKLGAMVGGPPIAGIVVALVGTTYAVQEKWVWFWVGSYVSLSLFFALSFTLFFFEKVRGGIRILKERVEAGDHEYFTATLR